MSGRLVGEVADWLCSPAAAGLTLAERTVLLVIAERAHETTRDMWRHKVDDLSSFERICAATGLGAEALTKVLRKLAARGLEVRVQVGVTRSGAPVFAFRGRSMKFRLPVLPASAALPERVDDDPPFPVDKPVDCHDSGGPEAEERADQHPLISEKGRTSIHPFAEKGGRTSTPNPSKDNPSKDNPSSPMDPSSPPDVEDTPPASEANDNPTSHMGWDPDYREASAYLLTLAHEGQSFMDAAADQLGAAAPVTDRVIHAARLAHEGIPA